MLLIFSIISLLSYFVGKYGEKREIGFLWSFLLSVCFSPLIGYFIASESSLISDNKRAKKPTIVSVILAGVFLVISIFLIDKAFQLRKDLKEWQEIESMATVYNRQILICISLSVGFLFAAVYASRFFPNKRQAERERNIIRLSDELRKRLNESNEKNK